MESNKDEVSFTPPKLALLSFLLIYRLSDVSVLLRSTEMLVTTRQPGSSVKSPLLCSILQMLTSFLRQ